MNITITNFIIISTRITITITIITITIMNWIGCNIELTVIIISLIINSFVIVTIMIVIMILIMITMMIPLDGLLTSKAQKAASTPGKPITNNNHNNT